MSSSFSGFPSPTQAMASPYKPSASANPARTPTPATAQRFTFSFPPVAMPVPSPGRLSVFDLPTIKEKDGVVKFGSTSYRYEVHSIDEKLTIWIEDRTTKKQWQATGLALADFAKDNLVIPVATFDDYVELFRSCLQHGHSSFDFSNSLTPAESDKNCWELSLTLKIRIYRTTWSPTYKFLLKPVPLQAIDILAAKIRDQAEVIQDMEDQLQALLLKSEETKPNPVYFRGVLMQKVAGGTMVPWKASYDRDDGVMQLQPNGAIRFSVEGTFSVHIMVQNTNSNNGATVELALNAQSVVKCVDSDPNGHIHLSTIFNIVEVKPNDELAVIYAGSGTAHPGSYLVIHQLG